MTHRLISSAEKRAIFSSHHGIAGVAEGTVDGEDVIVVQVDPADSVPPEVIPESVNGVRVVVRESPRPDKFNTGKYRPVQAGVTTSNIHRNNTGSGTIGPLMTDGSTTYLTSNWHVWDGGSGSGGDWIIQPGVSNGGESEDFVAEFAGSSSRQDDERTDVAWATPRDQLEVTPKIYGLGVPQGTTEAESGDAVAKSGARTGVTRGSVEMTGWTGETAQGEPIDDATLTTANSRPGDSGSPVMLDDGSNQLVGVLFGGSEDYSFVDEIENWEASTGLTAVTAGGEDKAPDPKWSYSTDGLTVHVDASDSSDPDGSIDVYGWDWGDGTSTTAETASHTYQSEGTYTITLTLRDDDGNEATLAESISVAEKDSGTDPGTGDCTWHGTERSKYNYCGSATSTYQEWANCEITTDQFQQRTGQGEGTAALTTGECGTKEHPPGADTGMSPVVVLGALGAAYMYSQQGGDLF